MLGNLCSSLLGSGNIFALAQAADTVDKAIPFYRTGWFVVLLLIAAVVLGIYFAKLIAATLRLNDYSGRMALVLVVLLVASLMIWSKWPPKFGVDLRGGINIVGSLNLEALQEDDDSFMAEGRTAKDIIRALVRRVNPSGTKEIMIRPLGEDKIEVTIPSVDPQEADAIWARLVKAGKLEFRIVANGEDFPNEVDLARKMAEEGGRGRGVYDTSGGEKKLVATWVDFAKVVYPENEPKPPVIPYKYFPDNAALIRNKATGKLINPFDIPRNSNGNGGLDLARYCDAQGIRTPQLLVIAPTEDSDVQGKHLTNVSQSIDDTGRGAVTFDMSGEGSAKMGMLTTTNIERPLGIVLDNQIHSAPNIQSAIFSSGQITGDFTQEEVSELIINLKSGELDVALNKAPISRDFIESTLGQELKEKGIWAIGSSLLLVLVFMVLYYRFAGVVATIALLLNLVFILALIMAINQPLTLTGLAGLVLTVGMSVDANVLIFERIREELDRGAALRMAIRNGFDKATTTIVDANVTTLITAIVLYVIGTEQIKGFSVTLILGILMSMFTAIYVSRLIFDVFERKRWLTALSMTRILDKSKFNFLGKTGLTGVVSLVLIVGGLFGIFSLGKKILNHDLRGGSTVRMVFNETQDVEEIRETLLGLNREHDGEKIEFTVTEFGAQNAGGLAGKVFKVDSNLPAWEGGDAPKFDQLDEILAEVFAGKLRLHKVKVDGPVKETGSIQRTRTWRNAYIGASIQATTSSFLSYQENESSDQEPDSNPNSETPDPQETTNTSTQSNQDEKPEGQNSTDPANGDEVSEDETSAQEAPSFVRVTRNVTVDPELIGKSVRALILEASIEADLALEEEQIVVDTEAVADGATPLSTRAAKWTVTLEVGNEAEADQILAVWAEKFNQEPYFPTASKVGGQIAKETQFQALAAIMASLLGIIAYVWIRFQNVAFGLSAVIALVHDVLIVLGAIAISHWVAGGLGFLKIVEFKISLEVVAALLTVIGYSLNDTIVVFDRIREVRGKRTEITADMINTSISQTLSRTILTSITTFIVVFILYFFGGDAIHGFAFALVIGVLVGTYSSIFVASPSLLWLMNTVGLNPGEVDFEAE